MNMNEQGLLKFPRKTLKRSKKVTNMNANEPTGEIFTKTKMYLSIFAW